MTTVTAVDFSRYTGRWYEIARYPNRFKKDYAADVTADCQQHPGGKIQVINSCRKADGAGKQSRGSAKVVDKNSNAKLKVSFFWPFYGNCWIVDLAPDYRYAVVSEPEREYLWILSPTPQMDKAPYERVLDRIQQSGLDPARLIMPKQRQGRAKDCCRIT